ncbi:MAG: hypothetical protein AB1458_07850 [Bacteroidota bacterium]
MKRVLPLFFIVPLLQACSFRTDFLVLNTGEESLLAEVITKHGPGVSGLFERASSVKRLVPVSTDMEVGWDQAISVNADSIAPGHYRVAIPPRYALDIGTVHNEEYTKGKRQFMNGRTFNLESVTLTRTGKTVTITPGNFDTYFKRVKKSFDVYCCF